ncbi:hypothetical protein SELMODRAFT_427739 [Selaginella moellendorffii]|uniref:Cyclin N-terminal domain-containing protein n=1 Tax=Selaginella moellendorffii TaxID=88036 RepID=D8T0K4_SELML|nr:hypothetical protein SELMODRAFT_427739 [Selaginella moellendorffii]
MELSVCFSSPLLLLTPSVLYCSLLAHRLFSKASVELQQGVASSNSIDLSLKDINAGIKDPHMYGLYYTNIFEWLSFVAQEEDFKEFIQQDINPVSEEYKLVPDMLYLTVFYIDCFLSANVISWQQLQLLGVSCMLISF